MLEELQEIVNRVLDRTDIRLTEKTKLKKLDVSSLSYLVLIDEIEDHFQVEIPNKKLFEFVTVGDVIRFLQGK